MIYRTFLLYMKKVVKKYDIMLYKNNKVIVMIRYYCSVFDINNAFGHGLGEMFKSELENTKSIVCIPGCIEKMEKAKNKYVPLFT